MNNFYLIALSSTLDREAVIEYLSSSGYSSRWFYNMPNSFFIKSKYDANQISQKIQEKFGQLRHFITKIDVDRQGWMPNDHWKIFYE